MIPQNILREFGAIKQNYKAGELIYSEGSVCRFYFQVEEGGVKLNNYSDEGKEFIQNIFRNGQNFGDVFLFIDEYYHTNAIATELTTLWKLPKSFFFQMLEKYPEFSVEINRNLSQRLYYKILMSQTYKHPEEKLLALLNYFKHSEFGTSDREKTTVIPLTRQQMADMTGLRVETVIRAIKSMEKKGILKIINRKIHF